MGPTTPQYETDGHHASPYSRVCRSTTAKLCSCLSPQPARSVHMVDHQLSPHKGDSASVLDHRRSAGKTAAFYGPLTAIEHLPLATATSLAPIPLESHLPHRNQSNAVDVWIQFKAMDWILFQPPRLLGNKPIAIAPTRRGAAYAHDLTKNIRSSSVSRTRQAVLTNEVLGTCATEYRKNRFSSRWQKDAYSSIIYIKRQGWVEDSESGCRNDGPKLKQKKSSACFGGGSIFRPFTTFLELGQMEEGRLPGGYFPFIFGLGLRSGVVSTE
ncbi:hypothetical protein K438DRAFT_1289612 [Mycena galopus ATCC 62051]|nr:hypothetical protein K438DRAFT_1289612 [Mycena galopus ATCC 62051]